MSWKPQSPLSEEDEKKKKLFAEGLLRFPLEPFKAALAVFPIETGKAAFITQFWPADAEVKAFQKELIDEYGEEYFLPNKATFAAELYAFFKDEKQQGKDRVAAAKTYAEVMGFVTKAGAPGPAGGTASDEPGLPTAPVYKVVKE